jgi:hypothetical protein
MQRRGWVFGLFLSLLGGWQMGHAADFTCTSTGGVGNVACLINAITEANANGETNTITLPAGTYTLTEIYNENPFDVSGPSGLPVITSTLTIMGDGAATTSIERAASAPSFRFLRVAATGTLTLQGLTLRGGGGNDVLSGGGIVNLGTLTLTSCTLTDNTATQGGGIINSGTATLTNCTLTGNTAKALDGGGIVNGFQRTLTLTNCTLTGNTAFGSNGGGGISNLGTATLTNSTLVHNVGGFRGGGIANGYPSGFATLTLTNSTVAYNMTDIFDGGGIFNYVSTLTLTNSTVAYNMAGVVDAGLGGNGGGIYNLNGSTTLQNTILALNTAPNASLPSDNCGATIGWAVTSLGTNLLGDTNGCTITRPEGGSDLTGDPGLDDFTTGDGAPGHGHFPLLQNSQAIDAGDDDICPDTDQLGQPRVDQCDIGAIEFQPSDTTPPTVTIVSVTPDTLWPPNGRLVPVTITGTITDANSDVDAISATYAVTDEYGRIQPSGDITLDANGNYTFTIQLQASRNDNDRDGRQYTIIVSAQDKEGNTGSADTIVTVPHDQGD